MEPANGFNGAALADFRCCACSAAFVISESAPCSEPWSHEVQDHVQQQALSDAAKGGDDKADHRLWLLFNGLDLVAAGAHKRLSGRALPSRYITFIAVQSDNHGKSPDGYPRYADLMLNQLVADARSRDPLIAHVEARVAPENERSKAFLRRRGFRIGTVAIAGYLPAALPFLD